MNRSIRSVILVAHRDVELLTADDEPGKTTEARINRDDPSCLVAQLSLRS